jgi:cytochrome c-type biogenesis protein CcmF
VAGLPRSAFGTTLAHLGIGLTLLGIVAEGGWSEERIVALKADDRISIGQFDLDFKGLIPRQGPNWRDQVGYFEVRREGVIVATLKPAKRIYTANGQSTTETGLETFGLGQLYASLGDPTVDGAVSARLYWKPLVTLIWLGGVVMAIGGVFSISDRRFRIGAPQPARRRVLPVPAE